MSALGGCGWWTRRSYLQLSSCTSPSINECRLNGNFDRSEASYVSGGGRLIVVGVWEEMSARYPYLGIVCAVSPHRYLSSIFAIGPVDDVFGFFDCEPHRLVGKIYMPSSLDPCIPTTATSFFCLPPAPSLDAGVFLVRDLTATDFQQAFSVESLSPAAQPPVVPWPGSPHPAPSPPAGSTLRCRRRAGCG